MTPFLRPQYRSLKPYTPGEQINADYIKLNTNESPYPPSPSVAKVLTSGIESRLRLYPDPTLSQLHRAVAAEFGVRETQVISGNGSDDVLAFSIMAYAGGGGGLVCPDITYGFYPVYANLFGANLTTVPLKSDFTIEPSDYFNAGSTVVIANPNAPTGILLPLEQVEQIIANNKDNIVIIDEAYMDFAGQEHSAVSLLEKYNNLIVTRTLSKSHSLAGLRVGFAMSSEEIIADLNRLRYSFNPYNLSAISIAAASVAIGDREYYSQRIAIINQTRKQATMELENLGFVCTGSRANFIFATHEKVSGELLYKALREQMILIRHFALPRIENHVRISVGTDEEMKVLVEGIKAEFETRNVK